MSTEVFVVVDVLGPDGPSRKLGLRPIAAFSLSRLKQISVKDNMIIDYRKRSGH